MKRLFVYLQCRSGATAIEYGLIAAGIGIGLLVAVFALGDDLSAFFSGLGNKVVEKTPS